MSKQFYLRNRLSVKNVFNYNYLFYKFEFCKHTMQVILKSKAYKLKTAKKWITKKSIIKISNSAVKNLS